MAIALVTSTTAASVNTTSVTSSAIDTTGADFLAVLVADYRDVSAAGSAVTDSKSNSYTGLTREGFAAITAPQWFYVANPTVGSGHTFTATALTGANYPSICVFAFSGVATTSPFDQEGVIGTLQEVLSGTSLQAETVTPTEDNELVLVGLAFNATNTPSINGGFSTPIQQQYGAGANFGSAASYLVQTTAAATSPTWTWSTSTDAAVATATFKAQASTHKKITQLTALTDPILTDLLTSVDDVAGTPINKKFTINELIETFGVLSNVVVQVKTVGSGTYTPTTGMKKVLAIAVGGGGAGAGGINTDSAGGGGGGGGDGDSVDGGSGYWRQ